MGDSLPQVHHSYRWLLVVAMLWADYFSFTLEVDLDAVLLVEKGENLDLEGLGLVPTMLVGPAGYEYELVDGCD